MTRIAVVSGGLSSPSSTRLLADRLAAGTAAALSALADDAQVEVIELRDHAHELADNLLTGFPAEGLRATIEQVVSADGLIAVTPIFNASYSGLFKTFFDVFEPDALTGMPVLIGATGGTARHSLALEHAVRPMFTYLRSIVAPTSVYAASDDWGSADGLAPRIERATAEFASLLTERPRRAPADPYRDSVPFEQLLEAQLKP
ncbi:FMN reductase [Nocardia callitridis]|uniref:NAD(P)H-dependent oxidoreductase n=1 Tax=Nocardia callitridis TaxID=648753 RepID=A0ABP9K5R8_9NOCA